MNKTCLIVEDDASFAKVLEIVINGMNDVDLLGVCDNTVDAVRILEKSRPDILLLDISISGLEGPEILELTDHQPKTIIISSHPEDIMDTYDVSYSGYIQKPLKGANHLIEEIRKVLSEFQEVG